MIYFWRGRLPYLKLEFSLQHCNLLLKKYIIYIWEVYCSVERFKHFYKPPLYTKTLNAGNNAKKNKTQSVLISPPDLFLLRCPY